MPLQLKQADELETSMEAQWAASNSITPKLTSGSAIKAIFQACVFTVMWLQSLIYKVYLYARAATCTGADLDSWMADYSFDRLPALYATGQVRLYLTNTSSSPTFVPVGTIVQTTDGSIQYELIADLTMSAFDPVGNRYIIPAFQLYADATVKALIIGSASNVQANQLKQFNGVVNANSVNNLAPILTGADPENDIEFRARFIVYINSLSRAVRMAILDAIVSVQQGMQVVLFENVSITMTPMRGNFVAVVNPASGIANSNLLAAVYEAIDLYRGFTISFDVVAAAQVDVTIVVKIRLAPGSPNTVLTTAQNAALDYIQQLTIGETLYISQLITAICNADTVNILSVQDNPGPTINGLVQDLTPSNVSVIRSGANLITVGTY